MNPTTVTPDMTTEKVTGIMIKNKIQQIPVVSNGKLVGLVTAYDLWKEIDGAGNQPRRIRDVMTTNVLTLRPKDKLGTAAELFADKRFKTLPVVNLHNELKGVVTAFDVIRQAFLHEHPRPILYRDEFLKRSQVR